MSELLFKAAQDGNCRTIEQLFTQKRLAVNAKHLDTEYSAAHYAAKHNKPDALKLLTYYGADLNARSIDRSTPAHLAADKDHVAILDFLAQIGANLDAQSHLGKTPALVAVTKANRRAFIALAGWGGANLTIADNEGNTAQAKAAENSEYRPFLELVANSDALLNLEHKQIEQDHKFELNRLKSRLTTMSLAKLQRNIYADVSLQEY